MSPTACRFVCRFVFFQSSYRQLCLSTVCLLALLLAPNPGWSTTDDLAVDPNPPKTQPLDELGLSFIANAGQLDSKVHFHVQTKDQMVWIGAGRLTLGRSMPGGIVEVLEMKFLDADPDVQVEGRDRLQGVANFYQGNDAKSWVEGVPTYGTVAQVDLYPGITQLYLGPDGQLKSELRVAPGADPAVIRMQYSGAQSLTLGSNGDLLMTTASGVWRESAPVVFQHIGGRQVDVPSSFELLGDGRVGFNIGAYDPAHELVVDPTFRYSTFLGGEEGERGYSIALDPKRQAHVCGNTTSTSFPLESPAQLVYQGGVDFFAAKLNPSGTALIYSTYIGGSGRELSASIALDAQGNAYCVGWTASNNFPVTPGAFQQMLSGSPDDTAIFKLSPTGTLLASTYLGGSGDDQPDGLAVNSQGEVFVVTSTSSTTFPTTTPPAHAGVWDVAVTKLNSSLSAPLIYSRLIGGSAYDEVTDIAIDPQGNAYVVGRTQSSDYPIHPLGTAYDSVYNGTDTAFLTKLDPSGANLVYSTFLDGIAPRDEAGLQVAVDAMGIAYVSAPTEAGLGFPPTPNVLAPTVSGDIDAVVMKVKADGSGLHYSTFLGGSDEDQPVDIQVDNNGKAYITGYTSSSNFPTKNPLSGTLNGSRDAFLAQLDPAGKTLLFSTYLGGSDLDSAYGVALSRSGPCLTGATSSSDFPTASPANQPDPPFQTTYAGGGNDAFVTCLDGPTPCPALKVLDQEPAGNCVVISDQGYPSSRAENFVLHTLDDAVLSRIQFSGGFLYSNGIPPLGSDVFEVRVYEAALAPPSLPQPNPVPDCTQTGITPSSRVDTLRNLGIWDLFEFTLELDRGCVLEAGKTYWVEIFESGTTSDLFAWECGQLDTANGIPGATSALQAPGTTWVAQGLDAAIKLFAEPLTCGSDPCLEPPPDMVFWAPFDDGLLGNISHDLVAGNNGARTGTSSSAGQVGQAIALNSGFVEVSHAPILNFGTGDFTLDFWIREPNYPPLGSVVAKYDPRVGQGFEVFWEECVGCPTESRLFMTLNGNNYQLPGLTVPENTPLPWTHVVIGVDRAHQAIHLYINGISSGPIPIALPVGVSVDNAESLLIGRAVGVAEDFSGELDELELFDRLLTSSEASGLFEAADAGKCKSSCYVRWDTKFCDDQQEIVESVEICNHSTTAKTYDLDFSPLTSITGSACSVPGPTVFTDLAGGPPPLTVSIPAQACEQVPFKIQRPGSMTTASPHGCYQVEFTDQTTGWTKLLPGRFILSRWCFPPISDANPLPFETMAVPQGENLEVGFELGNTTEASVTLDFLIEAMPLDMLIPSTAIGLNGSGPGEIVTGTVMVAPGEAVELLTEVANLDIQPFTFQDIILSTRVVGEESFIPLTSRGIRAPIATQIVIANQDFATAFQNSAIAIQVANNDFALRAALDLGSITILSGPDDGQATVPGGGVVLYQPDPGYVGLDSLRYQICDVNGSCDSANVEIRTQTPGPDIFADGFESGDTSAWLVTTP